MAVDSATGQTQNEEPRNIEPPVYRYQAPATPSTRHKTVVHLGSTDIVKAKVQILDPGKGESDLHSHVGVDTFWMVLAGRVRFHGKEGTVFGELGVGEGIITPRGLPYWFENIGDVPLQMLQVAAHEKSLENRIVFYGRMKSQPGDWEEHDGRIAPAKA